MECRAGSGLCGAIELPLGNPVPEEKLIEPGRLRYAAESHLRSTRVYDPAGWDNHGQTLRISVGVSGPASLMSHALQWCMKDSYCEEEWIAIAWLQNSMGDVRDSRAAVVGILDNFVTECLRANPECGR